MFIDELRELGNKIERIPIRDAIVFRLYESVNNYWDAYKNYGLRFRNEESNNPDNETAILLCPSFMPYENLCLAFDDAALWIMEARAKDGRFIFYNMFWRELLGLYKEGIDFAFIYFACIIKEDDRFFLKPGAIFDFAANKRNGDLSLPILGGGIIRPPKNDDEEGRMLQCGIMILNFLQILSCSNIRTIKVKRDAKLQRKREKKDRPPLTSYYTLKLQSLSTLSAAGAHDFWSNRVHLCRGHVREYGPPGLFGKYVGRFWIPPHARGNKSRGIVHKDYDCSNLISNRKRP